MRYLALPLLLTAATPSFAEAQYSLRSRVQDLGVSEEIVIGDYPALTLRSLTSSAEAVVRVVIRNSDTLLTSDGTAIVTDYRAAVVDVLKDRSDAHVSVGDVITIRRLGGMLTLEGRTIVSTEIGFASFASGGEYILFLKSGSGQPFEILAGPQSAFLVREGAAMPMTAPGPLKGSSAVLTPVFVRDVRAMLVEAPHTTSQR
jgi:hypothetical protein